MLSPVTRVNRPKSKKRRFGRRRRLKRRPWSRHPGEGETTDPGPDPARWGGRPPDAGQCPAGDDPAHHREDHRQGHPDPIPTSTTSMLVWKTGATATRPSAMPMANTHAMTTATAFARSTSTRSRASGRCCAPGCVPTAASPKRNCPPISASSSSFTTLVSAERHSSAPSLPPAYLTPRTTLKSGKSKDFIGFTRLPWFPLRACAAGRASERTATDHPRWCGARRE